MPVAASTAATRMSDSAGSLERDALSTLLHRVRLINGHGFLIFCVLSKLDSVRVDVTPLRSSQ